MRRVIILISFIALLMAGQIALAADTTPPQITEIEWHPLDSGSAYMTWATDEPADSKAEYSDTSPAPIGRTVSNATLVMQHMLVLTNMSPGTGYVTLITSTDAAGNKKTESGPAFTFTADTRPPRWLELTQEPAQVKAGRQFTVGARWKDDGSMRYAILYATVNEGGFKTEITSGTAIPLGTSDYTSIFQLTAPSTMGTTIEWYIKGTDYNYNNNATPKHETTIGDVDAPTITAWADKATTAPGGQIEITADISDDTSLAAAWLEMNDSGSWARKNAYGSPVIFSTVAGSATIQSEDQKCWVTETTVYGNEITNKSYESQSFTVTRPRLRMFVFRATDTSPNPYSQRSKLYLEIRPDKGGIPDMNATPLAVAYPDNLTLPNMTESNIKFNLDAELVPGTAYHAVLRGSGTITTRLKPIYYQGDFCSGNRTSSTDSGTTWQKTATDWNFWTYTSERPGPKTSSITFIVTNATSQPGKGFGWRVAANDSWGNTGTSESNSVKVTNCPMECAPGIVPGGCGGWSECTVRAGQTVGARTKLCFSCGVETGYACRQDSVSEPCDLATGMDGAAARDAISAAESEIAKAKAEQKNVTLAESLLATAKAEFASEEWEAAKDTADSAKAAALNAVRTVEPKPEEGGFIPYVIVIILVAVVMIFGWKYKLIRIPKGISKVKELPPGPSPTASPAKTTTGTKAAAEKKGEAESMCSICGRTFPNLFGCADCGGLICFDDARTYKGKPYCVSCLHKKGLL